MSAPGADQAARAILAAVVDVYATEPAALAGNAGTQLGQ